MAKLTKLPAQAIIDGMKGWVDYYLWMGIPCVRSWPRSPGHDRTPAVKAQWPAFTWASKNWVNLSPELQDAYRRMSAGTSMSGRDIFMKSYITSTHLNLP